MDLDDNIFIDMDNPVRKIILNFKNKEAHKLVKDFITILSTNSHGTIILGQDNPMLEVEIKIAAKEM